VRAVRTSNGVSGFLVGEAANTGNSQNTLKQATTIPTIAKQAIWRSAGNGTSPSNA
jgi:hypothetical protein